MLWLIKTKGCFLVQGQAQDLLYCSIILCWQSENMLYLFIRFTFLEKGLTSVWGGRFICSLHPGGSGTYRWRWVRTPFPHLSWPCPYTHKCPELCTCCSGASPSELLKRTSVLWFWYWPLNSFSQALISWIFSVLSFPQTGLDTWWHFINWHTYCRLYTHKQKNKQNRTKTTTPPPQNDAYKSKVFENHSNRFFKK